MIFLLEEIEQAGVKVYLAQAFNPPDGAQAKFMRNVLAVFAEFERDMIASRIADTRAYLKRHGRRIAGPAPFGYTADPATKQLVPVPKEARHVRLIFKRAQAGQTPAEIALRINHLKWRTKTWLAYRSSKQRGGGKWTARQVIQLLRNPVYVGQHRDTKGPRPGCHKPIVDKAVFDQVQAALDRRRTVTNPKRRRAMRFPLRGKIMCPKCGRRLSTTINSSPRRGLGGSHRCFYCCRSQSGGRAPCTGARYPAYELEQFVRNLLGTPASWRRLLPPDRANEAEQFSSLWNALGYGVQDDLMAQMIETVTFRRKNTEIQITFKPQCAEIISH
jgi:site-specific DNA recombinase